MEVKEHDFERLWFLGHRRQLARQILRLRMKLRLEFGGNSSSSMGCLRYNETTISSQFVFDYETANSHIGVLVQRRYLKFNDHERAQEFLAESPVDWPLFSVDVVQSPKKVAKTKKQRIELMKRGHERAREYPCLISKAIIDGRRRMELLCNFAHSNDRMDPCYGCGASELKTGTRGFPGYCSKCIDAFRNEGRVPHSIVDDGVIRLSWLSGKGRSVRNAWTESDGSWENIVRMIEGG